MDAEDNSLEELARRKQRAIALFTVLYCWQRDLDGVVFKKEHLLRLLGLEKVINRARVEWLKEGFRAFFPHREVEWFEGKTDYSGELNSFATLWVSRKELPKIFGEVLQTEQRLAKMPKDRPRLAIFEMWPDASSPDIPRTTTDARRFLGGEGNCDEKLLVSYLTLLCQGLISPQSIPSLRRKEFADLVREFLSALQASPKAAPALDDDEDELLNFGKS